MHYFKCVLRSDNPFRFSYNSSTGVAEVSTVFKATLNVPVCEHNNGLYIINQLADSFLDQHGRVFGYRDYTRYLEFNYNNNVDELEEKLFIISPLDVLKAGVWSPKLVGAYLYHVLGRDKFVYLLTNICESNLEYLLSTVEILKIEIPTTTEFQSNFNGPTILKTSNIFTNSKKSTIVEEYSLSKGFEVEDLHGNSNVFALISDEQNIGIIKCTSTLDQYLMDILNHYGKANQVFDMSSSKPRRVIESIKVTNQSKVPNLEEAFLQETFKKLRRSGIRDIYAEVVHHNSSTVNQLIDFYKRCGFELIFDKYSPVNQDDRVALLKKTI